MIVLYPWYASVHVDYSLIYSSRCVCVCVCESSMNLLDLNISRIMLIWQKLKSEGVVYRIS